MAFNKAKALDAAEKYLAQGKIAQAIEQYQNIFKHDPRDLSLLNTIGDLYIRLGQAGEAMSHFQRLAEAYVSEGFLMRAIAIYKKIAKLDPGQLGILEKLAELYAVQGLMSEARSQFLQLAESYLKANHVEKAVGIFRKMLAQEPENATAQMRLAELCERIGKVSDAVEAYLRAAERLAQKQEHKECLRLVDKILGLDGKHLRARLLKARSLVAVGQASSAISLLEPLAETEDSCAMLLLESYLSAGKLPQARTLGERVFNDKPDRYDLLFAIACHHEESGEQEQALEMLKRISGAMIEHSETEKLVSRVESLAQKQEVAIPALELLKNICLRTGEHFRVPDILDRIADAWGQIGEHAKAREVLEELIRLEPDNPHHRDRLNQLLILMGDRPQWITPPAQPAGVEEESLTLSDQRPAETLEGETSIDEELDSGTLKRFASAMTDADLMSSYGRPQKAIEILHGVLELVPDHAPAIEKLLDLYLGAGDWRRVAELAEQLSGIYANRGAERQAERFQELANRYRKQAAGPGSTPTAEADIELSEAGMGAQVEESATQPAGAEQSEVAFIEAPPGPHGAEALHEIDLSEEWEKAVTTPGTPPVAPPGFNLTDVREEVEFYIREGLVEEALGVIEKLAEQFPKESILAELREKALAAKESGAVQAPDEGVITPLESEETTILFDLEDVATGALEKLPTEIRASDQAAAPTEREGVPAATETPVPPLGREPEPAKKKGRLGPQHAGLPGPAVHEAKPAKLPKPPPSPQPVPEQITAIEPPPAKAPQPVPAASVAAEPVPHAKATPAKEETRAAEPFMSEPTVEAPEETVGSDLEALVAKAVSEGASEEVTAAPASAESVWGEPGEKEALAEPAVPEFTLTPEPQGAGTAQLEQVEAKSSEPESGEPKPVELSGTLPLGEPQDAPSLAAAETFSGEPRDIGEVETLELVLETPPSTGSVPAVAGPAGYDGNRLLADLAAEFEILPESAAIPQSGMVELSTLSGAQQLSEVLEEFRQQLGEADEVEDAETHYNLGIAYKEMGLLEEAISEFQKAFKIISRGQSGPSRMECCVQLAVCFMEKTMPQIAIKWYLKGLESPGLEPESVLALRYDLGVAYELSGDMNRALECYQDVYAMNIDYRDVADRISALSRPRA